MRKALLLFIICLSGTVLFAQESNVFYKAPDPDDTVQPKDSIPAFTQHCFGFYFMPAIVSNHGTAVPAPQDITEIGAPGTVTTYFSPDATEKAAFGFSFGLFYESAPFWSRFFYSVSLELADYKYTGNDTLITKSTISKYNSTENVNYSWIAFAANIPTKIHVALIQNKKYRLDIGLGVAPGFFISQDNSGSKANPNYDTFKSVTCWGNAGLGFEYFLGSTFIIRAEPCYNYNFFPSAMGRRLSTIGLQIGLIVK